MAACTARTEALSHNEAAGRSRGKLPTGAVDSFARRVVRRKGPPGAGGGRGGDRDRLRVFVPGGPGPALGRGQCQSGQLDPMSESYIAIFPHHATTLLSPADSV